MNYRNLKIIIILFQPTGRVFFLSVPKNKKVSLPSALFPKWSGLPQSKLLNMTFSCTTGQLDLHAQLSGTLEVIPRVLSLKNTSVAVKYDFATRKFLLPPSLMVSVKQISNSLPSFKTILSKLPNTESAIKGSRVSTFDYNPNTKELSFGSAAPVVDLIPNVVKLAETKFSLQALLQSNPVLRSLSISGTWKIGKVSLVTNLKYNAPKRVFHVTATTSSNSTLSARDFVQKITGNLNRLPSKLSVFTPRQIVGNIYDNGQYFITLQGSVEGGKIYVLFYKGRGGLKAGVAASMTSIKLSEVVKGTSGIDVGSVPFLGQLVVYSIALSITSGEIQSPTLPHIFGSNSPLHSFGDTLRAGAIATFKLDIGKVKGVLDRFDGAVVTIKLPKTVECSLQYLSSVIPGLSDAVKTLPKELKSAFSTRLTLIRYNITSKQISLSGVLKSQSIVPDVLSLSNVHITIVVALGKTIAVKSVEYKGTWKIGVYSINTVVVCDGTTKKIDVSGQAEGTLNVNTEKFLETIAGNDLVLPSSLSSFTITSITGRILPNETLIVFNGKVGSNSKISVVVYRRSERIELAVAADIPSFKLADLVRSGTGVDVSSVPLIGSIIIPDLKFAAATNNITSKLLSGLASKGSAIEAYKNGLHKGISRFLVKISGADNVVVEFAHKRLLFKIPTTAPLTVQALLSNIPKVKSSVQKLPSETSSVLSATVTSFTYDPVSTRMKFGGGIGSKVVIVPDFVTLTSVSVSVNVLLGPKYSVEKVDITGNWVLNNKLPIRTTISYSSSDTTLRLSGQLKSDVNLNELIKLLSRESQNHYQRQ